MRFRLKAFGLHLAGSATALTLVIGGMYLGWYRWPGWYLSSVLHVVGIVVLVDLVLGPTLTLVIANPRKPRRELARDIAMIVTVQLVALVYGAATLWAGRPLYYTFSVNQMDCVQASDLEADEIALALQHNPAFAPHWYSLPRWVWAPLPDDPDEAMHIVNQAALGGGKDVIEMPRYYRPWSEGLPKLREQLKKLDDIQNFNKMEKQSLRARLSKRGLSADERNALVMWDGTRRMLVVFDPSTVAVRALLKAD
ncbi:MAG TPA: hypothetical protein VMT66_06430 [Steroidobacteraceae bacterium]|nr:hypothetical protein [Steroidobacteraceae bacterium]